MAHTPGPWKVLMVPSAPIAGIVPAKKPKGVDPRSVEDICQISLRTDYDNEANAKLIAASPNLLAACKLALETIQKLAEQQGMSEKGCYKAEAALKEAIAEAT